MNEYNCNVCRACCTSLVKVTVRLGGHLLLDDVSFHLHCGELIALIGPNGAGKTTLLRAILGEIPYTGRIEFRAFGEKSSRPPRIGYVPQKLTVDPSSPMTVLDLFTSSLQNIPLWLGYGRQVLEKARAALASVDTPDLLNNRLAHLSGGELQRVLLALALTPMPHILLLDEPVAGLDQSGIMRFYQTISNLRKTYHLAILLVSHDVMAVSSIADRIVFLNKRILNEGSPDTVLTDENVVTLITGRTHKPTSYSAGTAHKWHQSNRSEEGSCES